MRRTAVLATMLLSALTTGCVERQLIVTCDTPHTFVYINGIPQGTAPVDASFIYYGKYEFKLVDPTGQHDTLIAVEKIKAPWYEYPPFDFIAENLWPFKIRDVHRLEFILPDKLSNNDPDVLRRAQELRERGQALGAPAVDGPLPPAAVLPGRVGPP